MTPAPERCRARTRKGGRCRNPAGPDGLCALHRRQFEAAPVEGTKPRPRPGATRAARPGTTRAARPGTTRAARPGATSGGAGASGAAGTPEPRPPAPGPPEGERSPGEEVGPAVVHSPPGDAYSPPDDGSPRDGSPDDVHGSPDDPGRDRFAPVLDWAEEALEFLGRRLLGEYEVDEFGHDPDLVEHVLAPLLRPLYRHWWRVETRGLEHVPDSGPALVVGNHAGTLPFDALMVALALLDEHPAHRSLRMLAADLAFDLPVVAPLARKAGNTLACAEDATRLLESGELVGVWPEGYKGLGKPYRERYQLQRFGRGGFVEIALRTGSPIVPVAVVGSEEIYPMLANLRRVARLLGFPYFPVTPTFPALGPLGAIPLPSKWLIEFCPPIETANLGSEAVLDPMVLFDLTDQVRDTIQQTVHKNLLERGGVFG
jgi:1-acyl-sn-glycerol-3-phosphate acyltransferase